MDIKISKLSLIKLSRRAGIKSISQDSYDIIKKILIHELDDIIYKSVIINSESIHKSLMPNDIYNALEIKGINLTKIDNHCL